MQGCIKFHIPPLEGGGFFQVSRHRGRISRKGKKKIGVGKRREDEVREREKRVEETKLYVILYMYCSWKSKGKLEMK